MLQFPPGLCDDDEGNNRGKFLLVAYWGRKISKFKESWNLDLIAARQESWNPRWARWSLSFVPFSYFGFTRLIFLDLFPMVLKAYLCCHQFQSASAVSHSCMDLKGLSLNRRMIFNKPFLDVFHINRSFSKSFHHTLSMSTCFHA